MSTKKIAAGDTLTVGDLTDDHRGAFIEVGNPEGIHCRMMLGRINTGASFTILVTERGDEGRAFSRLTPVKVITPPPPVQPDEPTVLGQCIRIEGDDEFRGVVADPGSISPIVNHEASWRTWEAVMRRAGDRQIIVSDPPRWPDETPEAPERIEVGEWPDDDTHLREWEWIDNDSCTWRWDNERKRWVWGRQGHIRPIDGPWTRGERVE